MNPDSIENRESVVLFDGVCNLCNFWVRFVIERDARGTYRFAPLDSDAARRLLEPFKIPSLPDSLVLIENDLVYMRSSAALRIARRLRFPWPLLFALIVIPRPQRDFVYDWVARNRYRWFGKRDACLVPTDELRARFLS